MAKCAWNEPGDCVNDCECWKLATGKHKVADRNLFEGKFIDRPLVDPFVVATNQHDSLALGDHGGVVLGELLASGREQDSTGRTGIVGIDCFDCCAEWFAHEHHSRTTTKGAIINLVVTACITTHRPLANVMDMDIHESLRDRPTNNTRAKNWREHVGEEGEDVDSKCHAGGGTRLGGFLSQFAQLLAGSALTFFGALRRAFCRVADMDALPLVPTVLASPARRRSEITVSEGCAPTESQ